MRTSKAVSERDCFAPLAEATFLAGLNDRQMNRVIDENILPSKLFRKDSGRLFARAASALAYFYFATEKEFTSDLRRQIITEFAKRLERQPDYKSLLGLTKIPRIDWKVEVPYGSIVLEEFFIRTYERHVAVIKAHEFVEVDPEIMGGMPVFKGTRVPIENIVASKGEGESNSTLKRAYSFLTDEMIEAAVVYQRIHPRRGRPVRVGRANPAWKLHSSKTVHATKL
jgi:uncharacterized protein (DUF433 family)